MFPAELLLRIFSFLSQQELTGLVAPVCRRWHSLIYEREFWREVTFCIRTPSQLEGCRMLLRQCADFIEELTLQTDSMKGLMVEMVLEGLPSFPHLVHLDMEKCLTRQLTTGIHLIRVQAPQLARLTLPGSVKYPLRDLASISEWTSLRSLNLNRVLECPKFRQSYNEAMVRTLIEACPGLEILIMNAYRFKGITDAVLQSICSHPTLRHLSVGGPQLTDASLLSLASCPHLQELRICNGMNHMTDLALLGEFPSGLTLLKLNLRGAHISSATLNTFFGRHFLTRLQQVQLMCGNITDTCLTTLAATCTHLQVVDIRYCLYITDVGVSAVLHRCRNLGSLTLTGSPYVDGVFLDLVPGLPRLTYLRLFHCGHVPHQQLAELEQQRPDLHLQTW